MKTIIPVIRVALFVMGTSALLMAPLDAQTKKANKATQHFVGDPIRCSPTMQPPAFTLVALLSEVPERCIPEVQYAKTEWNDKGDTCE